MGILNFLIFLTKHICYKNFGCSKHIDFVNFISKSSQFTIMGFNYALSLLLLQNVVLQIGQKILLKEKHLYEISVWFS